MGESEKGWLVFYFKFCERGCSEEDGFLDHSGYILIYFSGSQAINGKDWMKIRFSSKCLREKDIFQVKSILVERV